MIDDFGFGSLGKVRLKNNLNNETGRICYSLKRILMGVEGWDLEENLNDLIKH